MIVRKCRSKENIDDGISNDDAESTYLHRYCAAHTSSTTSQEGNARHCKKGRHRCETWLWLEHLL